MHYFPMGLLRLRCDEETEILGVDDAEMGEFAYDYVGIEAEIGHKPGATHGVFSEHIPESGHGGTAGGREPRHSLVRVHSAHDGSVEKEQRV
jgi:Amt family ammonium transporter